MKGKEEIEYHEQL